MRGLSERARSPTSSSASAQEVLAYGVERFHPRLTMACSFQKEESVLVPHADRDRRRSVAGVHDRHRRPVPGDARDLEGVRGPLRRPDRGARRPQPGRAVDGGALLRRGQGAALERGCPTSTPGSPASAASRRRPARPRRSSSATSGAGSGSSTRSPTGPRRTSGATSSSTICPTIRCTIRGMPRSAAPRARCPGSGREGRWAGQDKTECGIHV